jgi:hypothetical protein
MKIVPFEPKGDLGNARAKRVEKYAGLSRGFGGRTAGGTLGKPTRIC